MIRLYTIPLSTNVERVSLAMAYKGLEAEIVGVDYEDRGLVEQVSGQSLVPVVEDDGEVIVDSTLILHHLEKKYPDPPLFPDDEARLAETEIFIDWFNRAWKGPVNRIHAEMNKAEPDTDRIEQLGAAMTDYLDVFEGMLAGRDHLMGEFSVADCIAFPFLKFGLGPIPGDPYLYHEILVKYQPIGDDHPRLTEWIHRVDERPRV